MGILSRRVALVTGASSGLGERFAGTLREAGAEVVVTARRKDRLDHLAEQSAIVAFVGGITSPDHRQALASAIADRFGRLDILVNHAGGSEW
jgi:NADP-dependent 3-hydroxy acid dehydrogenase YdfG